MNNGKTFVAHYTHSGYRHCNRPLSGFGFQINKFRHDYIKYSDGSTTSYGPKNGISGPGHNSTSDSGGQCSDEVAITPAQEQKMKEFADKYQNANYNMFGHNCRDYMFETILGGQR